MVNICLGNDQIMKSVNIKNYFGILFNLCQEETEKVPSHGQVGFRMIKKWSYFNKAMTLPTLNFHLISNMF